MTKLKIVLMFVLMISLQGCVGCSQIDEGYRGVYTNFGKVVGEPLMPGLQFYNPFTSDIEDMDVRQHAWDGETECYTNDNQKVNLKFTVTLYPDPTKINQIYSEYGKKWEEKLINQETLGAIKDIIGKYKAGDLVGKREETKNLALEELKKKLGFRNVSVTGLNFTDMKFDPAYEQAVEAKVVAIQKAEEAKNKTVQIEEEAKQKVKSAEADATAMRIKSQALSQNKGLIGYELATRWDGHLPQIMSGGSGTILNISDLLKGKAGE